ncbi:conserved hypothetical protein [Agrobacterium fabacearum CFBP 5771]|uniref:hypothetical protein n=1 Tax=Agrobacterium tumefaciens TaxID=358 RepID=UPI0009BA4FC4|nr:hypothetical protein [Agrobacterium tumefaciens]CVI17453.1 conserved hypothetical protein [Agrobacterium fabacearum CFBP 5771]
MEPMQALVLTHTQLDDMLREAARQGAALAVAELRKDLHQAPDDVTLQRLKAYLADPRTITNPHDCWAHSGIIRLIEPTPRGKPKSSAWFMKFQRETGLADCYTRPSPAYGRRREWSFADIALAWRAYYRRR